MASGLIPALIASLAVAMGGGPALAQSLEYPVKATYLYKFVPFVEWPPQAFATPSQPVVLCVLGVDPFGVVLDQAVRGQRVGGRGVTVKRLAKPAEVSGCHVLYLTGSDPDVIAEELESVRGTPVLTVTDGGAAAGPTGIVNFVLKENRVRFVIDTQAAAQNGLTISSKLLSLALDVRGGR